ncbi:PREDICTED: vitellogenin-like [Dufourea novaeangliae]|uniref:vitellogenin-like n=1 Tax=Dufourea novaeangliae TaxID=178035 RepID=UPI0007677275|nr:PREDICTED: vitellogenin-like [Dufourea novaeangliae]
MLVTILPFLLAAHVAVDEDAHQASDWQRYGPECTYDVLVNMSLSNVDDKDDRTCMTTVTELRCRPKGSDTLSCRFANSKMFSLDVRGDVCPEVDRFIPNNDRFRDPFEVRFNSLGIENLVVPRNISSGRLDIIRDIVGQLNIGFELEKGKQRFVATEKSSVGNCEVEIKMSRPGYGRGSDSDRKMEQDMDIVFEPERPEIVPLNRAMLDIEKVRQIKKCSEKSLHFFGTNVNPNLEKNIYFVMTTSVTRIRISEKGMTSCTESTGTLNAVNKAITMPINQKISLSLRSITPAQSSLPDIMNPASTSLYGFRNIKH